MKKTEPELSDEESCPEAAMYKLSKKNWYWTLSLTLVPEELYKWQTDIVSFLKALTRLVFFLWPLLIAI